MLHCSTEMGLLNPRTFLGPNGTARKSFCLAPDCPGRRRCKACRNITSNATRTKHRDLPDAQRRKANCRAQTHVLVRRGKLAKGPCEDCGTTVGVESHHDDYTKPWQVRWKCRRCHRAFHAAESAPVSVVA